MADDDPINAKIIAKRLQDMGCDVSLACDGQEAIERLRQAPFDLLILDIEMPRLDGFGVLSQLERNVKMREIPVIVVSSEGGVDRAVKSIEYGAEDYLTKPVNPILLRARVNASLEKKRLRDEMRGLINRFVTPEVVEDIERSGFQLGGKLVEATVLFCDIRDFTSLAERQLPDDTIAMLNTFYQLMFEAIGRHSGIVTLMQGDGMMAVFGAPLTQINHSLNAVEAAIEMQEAIGRYNQERVERSEQVLRIGIGVASGLMVAGYTGTKDRAGYTCVGDVVNMAARLEEHTKETRGGIVINDVTYVALRDEAPHITVQDLGLLSLRGRSSPVQCYTVLA